MLFTDKNGRACPRFIYYQTMMHGKTLSPGKTGRTQAYNTRFKLVYYEACINEYDAKAREKYLKTGMGKKYLTNRLKRFLSLTG